MPHILVTNAYDEAVQRLVEECVPSGFSISFLEENTEGNLLKHISEADYLLASGRVPITPACLEKATKLKMLQRTGVGLDSIDLNALRVRGIPLYVNKGINSQSVAEHTILLMLACLRNLPVINRNLKSGIWKKQQQGIQTKELSGKTVGLIGLGNIGLKVAEILHSFHAKLLYYDPFSKESSRAEEFQMENVELDSLLRRCDIISLHCPLTANTRHMIHKSQFDIMKHGTVIINTARGGLIDEEALVEALRSGRIGAAGIDVYEKEPPSENHPFFVFPQVITTPHIAGVTGDSFRQMIEKGMENIRLYDAERSDEIRESLYQ